jgi:hypothetical protein
MLNKYVYFFYFRDFLQLQESNLVLLGYYTCTLTTVPSGRPGYNMILMFRKIYCDKTLENPAWEPWEQF